MTAELPTPIVLARAEHPVSRKQISRNALRVLYKLLNDNHEAYLVGGGVRDLLLGREPKDFDIATSARPETVRTLFRGHCRLIGRRFVLAHVYFGEEIIEVATFRALSEDSGRRAHTTQDGRLVSDNVYGTLPEDALRRDFTINALYYNPRDFTVLDFHAGVEDLRLGLLRIIGDPETRCREDPVRMLRAVRFAAKLGFRIEASCVAVMRALGALLRGVPPARLHDESLKLFLGGFALEAFEELRHQQLFGQLFPLTEASLAQQDADFPLTLPAQGLAWIDQRLQQGATVTPNFLFALLLWEPVRQLAVQLSRDKLTDAAEQVFRQQARTVAIPARVAVEARGIWLLQPHLEQCIGKKVPFLLGHHHFDEALQLFALRAQAGEVAPERAQWWQELAAATPAQRGERFLAPGTANDPAPDKFRRKPAWVDVPLEPGEPGEPAP